MYLLDMNMACYRKNQMPPPMDPYGRGFHPARARLRTIAATACVLAGLFLASCRSATQYIDRGNQLFSQGKYSDAILDYRNAIKKNPSSGEAYYRLGLALVKQNQVGEAYQAFSHAVLLDTKNMAAKVQLANLSLAIYTRDPKHPVVLYNQAQSIAKELLGPGGDRVEGLRIQGALALIDNHPGNAVDVLRQALQAAPNNSEVEGGLAEALLRDNQPEEAEKVALQLVGRDRQYAPGYEILYGMYVGQQNWDKAEAILKSWGANNPKESTPILRLAAFYYARKQPDDAEKTLNSMLNRRDQFPEADLLVGDFHALIRNPQQALADYQRGESRDHTRQEAYQERIASTLATLGRREDALKAANDILAKNPTDQFARLLKVQLLEQIGGAQNVNAAADLATQAAKDTPGNPRVQLAAGQALMIKGNLDEAATHFQRAADEDTSSPAAQLALARLELLRKNYAALLDHADAALRIRPNDTSARLFRVIGLTGTKAYGAAKSEAEQLAHDTKDAPQVEMQLGLIALAQGHYTDAEDLFRKLYKEGSPDLEPLEGLVNTYMAEHMPDRALALMREETQRSPDSKGKQALLVATAEAAGKNDEALSELQKMAAQNPGSAEVQARIGALQQKTGHLPEALQAYQRARQINPNRPGIDALIAGLQDQLGQKAEAIASYRKALGKSPDNPIILNNLAFLLADTGANLTEARQMVSTAIRKAPNLPQLQDTMAWIEIKSHDESAALQILATLTSEHPDDATFRYHYAKALFDSGNPSEAKEQAETALSKKPSEETTASLKKLLAQVN